jgi:integrase
VSAATTVEDRVDEHAAPLQQDTPCQHQPSPADHLTATELLALLPAMPGWPGPTDKRKAAKYLRGATRILEWLQRFKGDGWQQRWDAANGNDTAWINELIAQDTRTRASSRDGLLGGLRFLMFARALRPSYEFFHSYRPVGLYDCAQRTFDPELFASLDQVGKQLGMSHKQVNDGKNTLVRLILHTGADLEKITEDHFFELRSYHLRRGQHVPHGIAQAWDLLAVLGVLSSRQPLSAVVRRQGQRSTAELVDSYHLRCRPVREVLVRSLDERRAGMDYSSFRGLVTSLAKLFWADIEKHHRGIDSLHLVPEVADAWKRRLQVITAPDGSTHPRRDYLPVLVRVRAFYLDIQEWALEDASWAPWAVPCPVRRGETDGMVKLKKNAVAASHQRVRERLPHLNRIVDAADSYRRETAELLDFATRSQPGDTVLHGDVRYQLLPRRKSKKAARHMGGYTVPLKCLDTSETRDIAKEEDEAFWSWAIIETLRHTGIRLEELLEITHFALVQYQLPDTGEVVPLLQVVPSKNAEERLLLISPELANVLAAIITRVRKQNGGIIPAISRYDPHERVEGPALPHLFQRKSRTAWRTTVISIDVVYALLQAAVHRAGITDNTGAPLHYTPHDFRRMFTTEAVTGGLPVHIAAKILGHANLGTTQHYLAVFQDDMIRAYRSFLDNRRSVRPEAEYREPTEQEWTEFNQHFHERKLELGTCARPYGTPCQHEHACVRCPMLRMDPKQRARLAEIVRNLDERIKEARMNGWLGEVQGLQTSRDAAAKKLVALDRAIAQASRATNLGIPVVTDTPQRPQN